MSIFSKRLHKSCDYRFGLFGNLQMGTQFEVIEIIYIRFKMLYKI